MWTQYSNSRRIILSRIPYENSAYYIVFELISDKSKPHTLTAHKGTQLEFQYIGQCRGSSIYKANVKQFDVTSYFPRSLRAGHGAAAV